MEGVWGLAFLPAMFALWANLHGGFLAGLAVLLVWTAGATWVCEATPRARLPYL